MSRLFGPITQNGYVVRDLDAAVKYWTGVLGVGPFYVLPDTRFERYIYRGVESAPEIRIALANSGGLQIELIEQTNDAPSPYKEFIETWGPGLQHLSVWSAAYDEDLARIRDHGLAPVVDCKIRNGPRATFYGGDEMTGALMEVLDFKPPIKAIFDMIRDAATEWDGNDPVRAL